MKEELYRQYFATWLQTCIDKSGKTQKQISKELSISQSTFSDRVTGKKCDLKSMYPHQH